MMPSINDFQSFSGEMKVVGESVCNAENWIPLNEGLLEYRGLLHAKPQLLNTNISVMNRLDELRKAQISQKVRLLLVVSFIFKKTLRSRPNSCKKPSGELKHFHMPSELKFNILTPSVLVI